MGEVVENIDLSLDKNLIQESLSDLEKDGLIQRFEYTHELAWKVMKDYLKYQGTVDLGGSRDAIREAFKINLVEDGESWMDMIKSRNLTAHTYNDSVASEIFLKIVINYYPLFKSFQIQMEGLRKGGQQSIFSSEL
ncbi:MAG: nucleotidyltransferase substrate binding protein (TIGR01987 family) [Cyclobacteriaceae bacterium]